MTTSFPPTDWFDIELRIAPQIIDFALRRYGSNENDLPFADVNDRQMASIVNPWVAYVSEFDGKTAATRYFERERLRLDWRERLWLEVQLRACFSIREVVGIEAGVGVTLRDRLTDEQRFIIDKEASESLPIGTTIFARLVDIESEAIIAGAHPLSMPSSASASLIEEFLAVHGLTHPLDPRQIRGALADALARAWEAKLRDVQTPAMPRLANTDGDSLLFVSTRYRFRRADRDTVLERLASMRGAEVEKNVVRILRRSDMTVLASIDVGPGALTIETNSAERANTMTARVERKLGALIAFDEEVVRTLEELPDGARPGPPTLPEDDEARQTIVREMKERYYKEWLRKPVPALDGLTPMKAKDDPEYRPKLIALLEDFERHESRVAEGERYDMRKLCNRLKIPHD